MANYDAEVRVSTKVDTSQMQRLQMQIDKAAMKVDALTKKCDELKSQKVPTGEFSALQNKLQSAQDELKNLIEKENELSEMGLEMGAPWDNLIQKEADVRLKIEEIMAAMQKMKETGGAFTGIDPEKIREAEQELHLAKGNLMALVMKWNEVNEKQDESVKSSRKVSDGLKRIGEIGKRAFRGINAHAKQSSGLLHTMAARLKGILLSLLIFNWITKAFNNMVSGMKKGFQNLIVYSGEYNKSVSALKSANTQLQNSFAAAFMPIVQAAIPHLITLINYLTTAANAVAQFTAVITGKSSWIKAVAVQEDYASSLNGTAAAAKKAAGALASFDTLEVLNKKDTGGGSSGVNPKDMFEEVPVGDNFKLDANQLGKDFGNWLSEGLENIEWDSIKRKAEELGRNIARFLNGVWENERLAADLGMTIGEAANTAVNLAYGFIDENEWKQMGRFFGTLVQTGLETFDEEKAGETAGKLVNGFANTIIGYFQKYNVGTLGGEIASFFNRAVREADSDKIGAAAALLLGGFFTEIASFFDGIDAAEIGTKVSQAFIKFFRYAGDDGTVGEQVGLALAGAFNAGIDLLLGANIGGMSYALASFIVEVMSTALKQIKWYELIFAAITAPFDALKGAIGGFIGGILNAIPQSIKDALGITQDEIDEFTAKNKSFMDAVFPRDTMDDFNSALSDLAMYLDAAGKGVTFTAEQLQLLQDTTKLSADDIDSIIQAMIDFDDTLDLATIGLGDYQGSWEEFSGSTVNLIQGIKNEGDALASSMSANSASLKNDLTSASDYISTKNAEMASNTSSARELIGQEHIQIHSSLNATSEKVEKTSEKVSELSTNAESSLSSINANYSETLDNMTSMTDDWFAGMSQYFSTEQWQQFSDNITGTMLGCLDTMTLDWTTVLDEWMVQNNELYFGYDIWYEQFGNILSAYIDMHDEFQSEWQANTDTWWSTMVMPFFEVAQWQLFGTNMKTGIMQGFKVIVNEMGGVMNKLIVMFDAAFKELEEAMNDLIDSYNASASTLGTSTLSRVHYKPMGGIKIPALANGAVIRGGSPFLAILGDQPHGQTNVETPLATMVDAFNQALDSRGASLEGNLTVNLVVNGERWAQATLDDFIAEVNRRGGIDIDLIGGTT